MARVAVDSNQAVRIVRIVNRALAIERVLLAKGANQNEIVSHEIADRALSLCDD